MGVNALEIIRLDKRINDQVEMYDFELRVGKDGPVLFKRTYADSWDMEDTHNAGYTMIFHGMVDGPDKALEMFKEDVYRRLIGLFDARR